MLTDAQGLAPRRAALKILERVRGGAPFDAALDRAVENLGDADRRLAHELAAGVLRRQDALDARLAPLVPRGWKTVTPQVRDVLRVGAYQLEALERVPAHAAVDTAVALAKTIRGARVGGFVNAVLRRLARDPQPAPEPVPAAPDADPVVRLAAAHSHPAWLVARWMARFGHEETERLLRWNDTRPRLVIQPARASLDELAERWRAAGIVATPAPFGAGLVVEGHKPDELPGFAEGDFVVQDPAHALLAWFADVPPDATVYDACAAPGGKAIALGREAGRVVAGDTNRARGRRLAQNLRRAGSGREFPVVADARHPPIRAADVVLVDAPCLGTGTFARHPDARWRVTPDALATLAARQAEILNGAAAAVRPGGLLLYATCSLEPEENERQVDRFLTEHPEFGREPPDAFVPALLSPEGDLMIHPQRHAMDGAFAARLRRAG